MTFVVIYAIGGAAIGAAVSLLVFALLQPKTTAEVLLYTLASATLTGSAAVIGLADLSRPRSAVPALAPDMRAPEAPCPETRGSLLATMPAVASSHIVTLDADPAED